MAWQLQTPPWKLTLNQRHKLLHSDAFHSKTLRGLMLIQRLAAMAMLVVIVVNIEYITHETAPP